MLTEFGNSRKKAPTSISGSSSRKLRIEKEEQLVDMASKLGITRLYLSVMGNVPEFLIVALIQKYNLDFSKKELLAKLACPRYLKLIFRIE